MRLSRSLAALTGAAMLAAVSATSALAQSGQAFHDFEVRCADAGGISNHDANNPVCTPSGAGGDPAGGYSADQQVMLDLASQFGTSLGAAIREGFRRSAERQQRLIIQQAYEEDMARQQAAVELERQRQRNQTLIANMHGAIANPADPANALSRTQLGTETLRLRTADEMFNHGGGDRGVLTQEVPVSAPLDLAEMQAAQDAYFEALDDANEADQAVLKQQSQIENLRNFTAEAQHQRGEQSILLAAMSDGDPGRRAAEANLAHLDSLLAELHEHDGEAAQDLIDYRAEAARAHEAFRLVQERRAAVTPIAAQSH